MEFNFAKTTSREELQALPMKQKIAWIQRITDEATHPVNSQAGLGMTSYLWEMDETKLAQCFAQNGGRGVLPFTLDELMQGLRARFPGCKVDRVEEWMDVPTRMAGQQPTRILKSGIKIDWA
jgi:hypothetical protein